jgi:hypothetical protein
MAKVNWFRELWIFFVVPVLIIPLALAEKWGPRVFGAAWFARHGKTVMIVGGILIVLLVVGEIILPSFGPMRALLGGGAAERRIRKSGRPARAIILAVGENSGGGVVTINNQPYLNLVVRVEDGVSSPYEANFDAIIPRASLPQMQPGAVVKVKVDPQDPRKVVLDY